MAKYSYEFKKEVVEAYLRGEGGYKYQQQRNIFLLLILNRGHAYAESGYVHMHHLLDISMDISAGQKKISHFV